MVLLLFNSYIFIFLFLPVCLTGFYLLKDRAPIAAKCWLIGLSLWFYGYFNLGYLAIMLFSIAFNYGIYRWMLKKRGRLTLIIGIAGNLGLLLYFKYTDFLIDSTNVIFKTDIPLKHILLPLGISFFTFQQIGFIADTYRGETKRYGFVDYCLFVCFFPQLIAGPIVGHEQMMPQITAIGSKKGMDGEKFCRGAMLFILGLAKKVLIADTFGKAVDMTYGALGDGVDASQAILTILFYTLQLYFDFSGYCDMALGLGRMLGIDIPVNFDSPYKSRDITEFWKRWHITLNKFLTKNVYIPLGGNRKGNVRTYVNLLAVFLISGIWHGAGVTFIIWGLLHGIIYVITRMVRSHGSHKDTGNVGQTSKPSNDKKTSGIRIADILSIAFTFIFVNIAWVFFRAETVKDAITVLKSCVMTPLSIPSRNFAGNFNLNEFWYVLKILHIDRFIFAPYIMMAIYTIAGLIVVFTAPNAKTVADRSAFTVRNGILYGILLLWCVVSLSGVSTFLYFNF